MGCQEPDPVQPVDVVQPGEQVGQVVAFVPVVTIGVNGLPQHRDLADPAGGQQFNLVGHVVHRPADLPAAPVGDDAEGAHQVAAVDDGHVGCHVGSLGRQGADAALPVQAQALAHYLQQRLELLGPQEQVNVGEARLQFFSARADHAAGQCQHGVGSLLAQGLGQVQGAGDLVLGGLADHARVEHHHVRIGGARHGRKAQLLQRRPQAFGVGGIHLAAYGPDVVGLHSSLFPSRRGASGMEMAEGVGFEPTIPVSQDKRLAGARTRPLCDPSLPFWVCSL